MLKMLKYKAKNAKHQRTLLITIKIFTSVMAKGIFGHLCFYTRQVGEITLPGGSTYNVQTVNHWAV